MRQPVIGLLMVAMNAALIGSVSSSAATLRGMLRGGLEVVAVCGLHERHAATVSDYCDLRPLAAQLGAEYVAFDKVAEPQVREVLERKRPDWLFVVGLSQLVPASLRDLARAGAVGFHPTMLPEGRGRAPVAWTILLDKPAAANIFYLTDEADAGDLIAQRPVPVLPDDYAADLIERTDVVLEDLVAEMSSSFASGRVPRIPQDHTKATYYARRRPEDGLIDWNTPADAIYRLVRAVSRPYPGAFTYRTGEKVTVWRARPVEGSAEAAAGTVVALQAPSATRGDSASPERKRGGPASKRGGSAGGVPIVQTASGLLALTDIELTGGPLVVGERLG